MLVPRTLPCDHVLTLECHKNFEKFVSKKVVEVHLPCGHKTSVECHVARTGLQNVSCKEKVKKELLCKHKLILPCYKNPEDCLCRTKVEVKLPCGHLKLVLCSVKTEGLPSVSCTVKVPQALPCGHEVTLPCHIKPQEHCCEEQIAIELPCGHKKLTTCSSKRDNLQGGICDTIVRRKLPCGHVKEMKCSEKPCEVFCEALCERIRQCGHPCPNKCGDDCATFKRAVGIKKDLNCGYHKVSCLCSEDVSQLNCSNQCKRRLMCGHQCPENALRSVASTCAKRWW